MLDFIQLMKKSDPDFLWNFLENFDVLKKRKSYFKL
jgi:hypothetical protein